MTTVQVPTPIRTIMIGMYLPYVSQETRQRQINVRVGTKGGKDGLQAGATLTGHDPSKDESTYANARQQNAGVLNK
jgi:hypothetical protein